MKSIFNCFLVTIFSLSISSCLKIKEVVTPLVEVKSFAEIQKETLLSSALLTAGSDQLSSESLAFVQKDPANSSLYYLNLKYNISNLDVYEEAHLQNGFEQFGNSLLKALASLFLKLTGGKNIKLDQMDVPLPHFVIDYSMIKSIKLKRVYLRYNKDLEALYDNKADFSFIKKLNLKTTNGESLVSYNKNVNDCQYKCLNFTIDKVELLDLFKDQDSIPIAPSLSISSLPKVNDLKLDGQIEMQIGIDMPF